MTGSSRSRSADGKDGPAARKALLGGGPPPIKTTPNVWPSRADVWRAKLVFYLFLASLAVFFAAGLVSYCIIRIQAFQMNQRNYLVLELPRSFFYSTVALVLVSGFLQLAVGCIRREQQSGFRLWLLLAWFSAAVFLIIQYFGMGSLLNSHYLHSDGSSKVYGICFTLALLHALHVLGGMGFLAFVIWRGYSHCYDHERHYAVEHCAAYWHFLDVVWLIMLATFLLTR
jgi:cytochrome c oxidase subunit 3